MFHDDRRFSGKPRPQGRGREGHYCNDPDHFRAVEAPPQGGGSVGSNRSADDQYGYFRGVLVQILHELLKESDKATRVTVDTKETEGDFTDQASSESDRVLSFRIEERKGKLLNKVKDALRRLDNGTFGLCEECGGKIAEKRLKARPTATLCIECKEKEESLERMGTV